MSSISRFQQLPKCLLKGICKHVMPIIGNNTGPRPCIAMLRTDLFSSLGSTWREAALEHYFDHFTLAFNSGSGKVNSTHPVEDGFISIEQERHALTSVKVCVALDDLLSGKAAHMLAQSKYSPLVFPSVKTMKIDINEFHRSGWAFDASNVVSTPSLYQQFQTMFPGVKSVQLMKGSREASDNGTANCEFVQFVLGLFAKFSGVCATFDLKGSVVSMWDAEDIYSAVTELTTFEKCSFRGKFELIRKCAPTLRKLEMHAYTGQDVLSVFMEASGKPIEYPRLTTLNLAKGNGSVNPEQLEIHTKNSGQFAGFNSVCSLIEKLPQLVHLCVAQLDFDYGYDYSCRVHVYNEFTSEWPVLSQQFRCCDVVMESNIEELATFGMLLAVMCPRLTRFMSNSQSRELVQEEIDAAIQEEPFIEHTAKLKLLTYNGIPEGSETFAVKQVYW
ncbi:hypothetical protein IW152_003016 [Coemansia sp. BCRC 34962]|nr:hypothetical protein IW152_003016 [Coemansia sp. BCRC 34962]